MTQAQPPAAPAPNPNPPAPTTLADSDATAAANARVNAAFPEGNQPGTPADAPPTAVPGAESLPVDLFTDEGIDSLDFGNIAYRDGAKLRAEVVRARDTYRPFRDAFGALDDQQRQVLLDSAPTLGADLATTTAVMARLHPQDREYFNQAMATMIEDPVKGAQMLADGADLIRQAAGYAPAPAAAPPAGEQPMPDWAQPPADGGLAPESQPMTRGEFEAELAARDERAEVKGYETQILADARALGYDPEAQMGSEEYDRFSYLLTVAGQPDVGFDLNKAHERVGRLEQAAVDRFVQAKSADATRPAAPAVAGVAPAESRALETMTDGQAAMRERLAANLGPDPRARGPED